MMPDFVPLVQSLQKLMVVGGYGRIANQGLSKAGIGHIYFAPPPPRIMTNVLSLSVPPPSYFKRTFLRARYYNQSELLDPRDYSAGASAIGPGRNVVFTDPISNPPHPLCA